MAKPSMDDEIDLTELIQIFWQHRIKFIVMGLLGLILGLSFTFIHEPVFLTKFKFSLNHPIIKDSIIYESYEVQKQLNFSELNKDILPHYSLNNRTNVYTVKSDSAEMQTTIDSLFRTALSNELIKLKNIALSNKGYSENRIIVNNNEIVKFTNKDIANLNIDEVLNLLIIRYSEIKSIYPHPLMHGSIGVFIGLILGFVWMILAILIDKVNLNNPKRKT